MYGLFVFFSQKFWQFTLLSLFNPLYLKETQHILNTFFHTSIHTHNLPNTSSIWKWKEKKQKKTKQTWSTIFHLQLLHPWYNICTIFFY